MIKLGLIGYPVGHSLSPRLHDAALKSCGLDGSYALLPIPPADKQGLKDLLTQVRTGGITGLNVTIPHKQNVIDFLDELTPTASAIGAVNTIYKRNNKLIGDNTDAPGFLVDLKTFLTTDGEGNRALIALVLGAGGSARGVIYALINDGWNITLAARRIEQAKLLADLFAKKQLPITVYCLSDIESPASNLQSLISTFSLIVNTTPLGMTPNVNHSPWPERLPLPARAAIYDLVYNPRVTKLVGAARQQGLPATTGLGMLVEQAALAFEIWTGHRPSREFMSASVKQSLISNQ